jgi:hypothetical protein
MPTMTMHYEGPRREAELAAVRSLGLGLTTVGPTEAGERATFTTSVASSVSWVQVLSLVEVLGCTRSPFEFVDRDPDATPCGDARR